MENYVISMKKGTRLLLVRNILIYIVLVSSILFLFGGCSKQAVVDKNLIGTWKEAVLGYDKWEFRNDGVLVRSTSIVHGGLTAEYKYEASDGQLKVDEVVYETVYEYMFGTYGGMKCIILTGNGKTIYLIKA